MAVDYYIQYPCKVREAVSDVDLLRMEKARNRAAVVLDLMRQNPGIQNGKPESEWTFTAQMMGPNGVQEAQMKIGDLLQESAPLDTLAVHCRGCPANLQQRDFGCGGAIHYPIPAAAEAWLLSRLPDDLNTRVGHLLVSAIADFKYDGAPIDASRSRQELYESPRPVERKWGSLFSKKTRITSSQILEMLLSVGSYQAGHAQLVAYLLGYVDDAFAVIGKPEHQPQAGDTPAVAGFKLFLWASAFAGAHDLPLLIDA